MTTTPQERAAEALAEKHRRADERSRLIRETERKNAAAHDARLLAESGVTG